MIPIISLALSVTLGIGPELQTQGKRPGWLHTGPLRPLYLPAQHDGSFSFDDLKQVSYVAIVRPDGLPVEEERVNNDRSRVFGIQKMRVVSGPNAGGTIEVVVWQPLQDVEPFGGFKPLLQTNYLLIADRPKKGQLAFARSMFVGTSARPGPSEFHHFAAKPVQVAGWSLIRTPATAIPAAASTEEGILRAVVEACALKTVDPDYDPRVLMQRIHSERDMAGIPLTSPDEISGMKVDRFYKSQVVPRLWEIQSSLPREAREKVLDALAAWNIDEAKRELDLLKNASNP